MPLNCFGNFIKDQDDLNDGIAQSLHYEGGALVKTLSGGIVTIVVGLTIFLSAANGFLNMVGFSDPDFASITQGYGME